MSRSRRQLRVRNPNVLLLLPLLARPHCHAHILRTTPVDHSFILGRHPEFHHRLLAAILWAASVDQLQLLVERSWSAYSVSVRTNAPVQILCLRLGMSSERRLLPVGWPKANLLLQSSMVADHRRSEGAFGDGPNAALILLDST